MSQESLLGNHYLCDLCSRQRPGEPREVGCKWLDGFFVCVECFNLYCRELMAAGRKVYVSRA
jgi:hypothetical protein